MAISAVGLALAPLPALAQDATTSSETPATDSVGPRDLQNFTLNGTVTRSAEPVAVPRSNTRAQAQTEPAAGDSARPAQATAPTTQRTAQKPPVRAPEPQSPSNTVPAPAFTPAAPLSPSVTAQLPPIDDAPVSSTTTSTLTPPAESLAGEHRVLLWPWLLAALALGAGGAFLFWRNRSRTAFAGGPQFDAFVAPEASPPPPRPARAPTPAPAKAPPAPPVGIVSTRLRPWVDLAFHPGRCIIEDDKVTFEFELGLQNSGNAPARGVLVEATLLNGGPYQDQDVSAFYGAPVGEGERIAVIAPLKTMIVKTKVVASRANVQLLNIGGRQVFVPLIAFNTLYSWSTGEGQTSASYLLGRDTKSEKLAPFRLDQGPRIVRSVGARLLPIAVRK
jgi:hypothetical protein